MATDEVKMYKQSDALDSIFKLQKTFDEAAKAQGIFYTSLSADAVTAGSVSTGVLALDLLLGGGHAPGRFTYFYGPTGSCKSTTVFHSMREAIKVNTKVAMIDSEASTDPKYLQKLGVNLDEVTGARNKKGWEVMPMLIHFYPSNVEEAFMWMYQVLNSMPDKIMMEDPKEGMRHFLVQKGYKYNPSSWGSIGSGLKSKGIIEVEDATPQLFILIDSMRMVPQTTVEDYKSKQPALLAKALHQGFPLIKPLLGKKAVNLIATNHLNVNPLDKYNKESEPGGGAVKLYPDVRVKLFVNRYKSRIITENHVSGDGYDRYSDGTAYIEKNKGGTSQREIGYRVWLDEQGEPGRGICPVYDMFQFLTCTNQLGVVDDKEGTFKILLKGYESDPMDYTAFKKFILTTDEAKKMKEDCHQQFKTGAAQEAYYGHMKTYNSDDAKKQKAKEKANLLGKGAIQTEGDGGESLPDMQSETEVEL